jgi:hypothetical protein
MPGKGQKEWQISLEYAVYSELKWVPDCLKLHASASHGDICILAIALGHRGKI